MNHKRKGLAAISLLGVGLLVAGCAGGSGSSPDAGGDSDAPQELTHITVSVAQADGANALPWLVGMSEGFFEENGVIVDEIIPAEGGGTTLQNVIAGDLPFGHVATGALVMAHNEGLPISVIAGATQASPDIGWSVGVDSDIQSVEDLEGKTWAFTNAGSVTEAMSYLVPLHAGLDMDQVNRVASGGLGAGIALLEAGEADVIFTAPQMEWQHPETLRVLLHSNEFVPAYQNTMIVSSRNYAQGNPEVARGLLAGLQTSIEWIYENPEAIAEMWAEMQEMPIDIAEGIIDDYIAAELWGLAFNPAALDAVAEGLFYTDGLESVDWEGLLTDEFLPEGHKGTIPSN